MEDKGKVCLTTFHENTVESRRIALCWQAQCQKEVGGNCHTQATLPLQQTQNTLYRKLGGTRGWSGEMLKISSPPGFEH